MVIDHRTYTVRANTISEYVKLFESEGLPIFAKYCGDPIGYFIASIGPLNQVVHLWGYDSLADMEKKRTARDADKAWWAYRQKSMDYIVAQENKILVPASFSKIK
ncbi:MAG: NIPSNAP family protein [Rhodospirillales bacterium]